MLRGFKVKFGLSEYLPQEEYINVGYKGILLQASTISGLKEYSKWLSMY
jgi:hypothetical protein